MNRTTYAVGDVHGRLDLLKRAFRRIAAHAAERPHRVVMLGDYVDRGRDSAGVIEFLEQNAAMVDLVCLKGNHEDMMLGALAGDAGARRTWLDNGGVETLRSYGASPDGDLRGAVPDGHVRWLSALPTLATDARRIYVHAGLAPGVPLADQDAKTLMWIRGPFLRAPPGSFEAHVVHGHSPHWEGKPDPAKPELLPHRTNLDTGAWMTGVLSVGVFDADAPGGPSEVLAVTADG